MTSDDNSPSVMKKTLYLIIFSVAILFLSGCASREIVITNPPSAENETMAQEAKRDILVGEIKNLDVGSSITPTTDLFLVSTVVDGDTIKVNINGTVETLRLIGIDTPETVDPRKPVQCFGREASNKAKELLTGKNVRLEADPTQGERDSYNRLLRYVFFSDGESFNKLMISQGYAHEYTHNLPYKYQAEFNEAEKYARENKLGLWADDTCAGLSTSTSTDLNAVADLSAPAGCMIKGNISTEKIYHLPGCGSYDKTVIDESKGERWFCSEKEAIVAGWRKAKNCL